MAASTAYDPRVYRRRPEIEEAPLQGELMLFDPGTSRFFVLNRTMAYVWRRCDGQHTVASMIEDLASEFDGLEGVAAASDLNGAVLELASLGLLVDSAPAHPQQ
jgi:hypothetical protein